MTGAACVIAVLIVVGLGLFGCSIGPPSGLGVSEGRLAPCPESPNCVSSQSESSRHAIAPFQLRTSPEAAITDLRDIIESMKGVRLVTVFERYLHAEFRSALFRFVDDLECVVDEAEGVVHVRSASRFGYWDFGVNRRRVETIRIAFEKR